MQRFEIKVREITATDIYYLIEAENKEEAITKYHEGNFISYTEDIASQEVIDSHAFDEIEDVKEVE